METLSVALGERSYDIIVGGDLISKAGQLIAPLIAHEPVIIVTDDNVAGYHLGSLQGSLKAAGIASTVITNHPATKGYQGRASFRAVIENFR